MPILFYPPSRRFSESTYCPAECTIPTADSDAYDLYPQFRWVYNKLTIAELQRIRCGPHKTKPGNELFPIFSKPIYNLGGMGTDARVILTADDYWHSVAPGHMWSVLLTGEHYSTDIAVITGRPVWFSHTFGVAGPEQTWDYWEVNISVKPSLREHIAAFIETHLAGFTGMLNMETIGGKIIEVHLRFSPQWPDLYGSWFLSSLVGLYRGKGWTGPPFFETQTQVGYSVVLFGEEKYARIGATLTEGCLRQLEILFEVNSITMWYDPNMPLETYPRPPGGFRIAWMNGFDLGKCKRAIRMFHVFLRMLSKKIEP